MLVNPNENFAANGLMRHSRGGHRIGVTVDDLPSIVIFPAAIIRPADLPELWGIHTAIMRSGLELVELSLDVLRGVQLIGFLQMFASFFALS